MLLLHTRLGVLVILKLDSVEPVFEAERTEMYNGPVKAADFSTYPSAYNFRTRIRQGVAEGVKFAGRVAIIPIGCGTDCGSAYAVDLTTGRIYTFPLGGENYYAMVLQYRPWSRLISAVWYKEVSGPCLRQNFVWRPNEGFVRTAAPAPSACSTLHNDLISSDFAFPP